MNTERPVLPENVLSFVIDGHDEHRKLEEFSSRDIATVLKLLEEAIAAGEIYRDETDTLPIVSVESVTSGSAKILQKINSSYVATVTAISLALSTGDFSSLPVNSHKKLHELSDWVTKKNLSCSFAWIDGRNSIISQEKPVPPVKQIPVYTIRTIYGMLISVGGQPALAKLVPLSGGAKLPPVKVSRDMAKDLGKKLYDVVGLTGKAVIDVRTDTTLSFEATRILPYKGVAANIVEAMRKAEQLSPGVWRDVNIEEFVAGMRDEEEEFTVNGQD